MGPHFLTDTNAIIDFFKKDLPQPGIDFLSSLSPKISIVTYIELFCKSNVSDIEEIQIKSFVNIATIYHVDRLIAEQVIRIRKEYKLKLPDAIIAATAIHYNLTLVTRNIKDFEKIEALNLINPHSL